LLPQTDVIPLCDFWNQLSEITVNIIATVCRVNRKSGELDDHCMSIVGLDKIQC